MTSSLVPFLACFVILVLLVVRPAASADADQVRARCVDAFELAFPRQGWASENSLRSFAANVSTERRSDTHFACPLGGGPGSELHDFAGGDLLEWFLTTLNPNVLRYTEIVTSEVSVANNVCSMDKLFFAEIGDCHVHAMSRLMIEVDEDGKLVRWLDHYDREDLNQKMGVCNLQLGEKGYIESEL
ncbi:hypothetical protein ACHAWF_007616 [Thalassiosira exigua]